MMMSRTVAIRCYFDGLHSIPESNAVVAIDVIRATTTAVTAVAMGRRCYPVATVEAAKELAKSVPDALLVGELGGAMAAGFDMTNSPAELATRTDRQPIVLLSSSGTQLIHRIRGREHVFVACFRNQKATVRALAHKGRSVNVIGAGTRGQFREEDQMCAAWIASGLIAQGYSVYDPATAEFIGRWKHAQKNDFLGSESVSYLRRSNQVRDLDFILAHFDDIDSSFMVVGDQIVEQ
jgi:2-phosphosulfolactate phosphatase